MDEEWGFGDDGEVAVLDVGPRIEKLSGLKMVEGKLRT